MSQFVPQNGGAASIAHVPQSLAQGPRKDPELRWLPPLLWALCSEYSPPPCIPLSSFFYLGETKLSLGSIFYQTNCITGTLSQACKCKSTFLIHCIPLPLSLPPTVQGPRGLEEEVESSLLSRTTFPMLPRALKGRSLT